MNKFNSTTNKFLMPIYSLNDISPTLPNGELRISSSANIIGDVRIGINVGIWFGAVLRGIAEPIIIGEDTNIRKHCYPCY